MPQPQQHDPGLTVPVILDGLVREGPIGLARCTYFSIAAEEPLPGWGLRFADGGVIPFLLLGLQGILIQPANGEPEFTSPYLLDELIRLIERHQGLSVELEYLWLPDVLVERAWAASPAGRDPSVRRPPRGGVFRVGSTLFATAFQVARDGTDFSRLGFAAEERVGDAEGSVLRYSPVETDAVRRWSLLQALEHAGFNRSKERG